MIKQTDFLPMTIKEMAARGWDELDVIIITGDAYVDHPAFGAAVIGRFLENLGLRVGIIAQPDWKIPPTPLSQRGDFRKLGRPRLFFGVTAGNLDSMLALQTAQRKLRSDDAYSPGGKAGLRPARASIVYTSKVREAFPGVPIILGGIEASLRRFAHYDFWSDKIRRSILLDAKADLLVYGMAERPLKEIVERLKKGESIRNLRDIRGTAYPMGKRDIENGFPDEAIELPSFEEVVADKTAFARMTRTIMLESNPMVGRPLAQRSGNMAVVVNPGALPLTSEEMDAIYELPFKRAPHPSYRETIPALEQVRDSITIHRGCFGGCAFCALTLHQGRIIQSRTVESVIREVKRLSKMDAWKEIVSDLGGPTANMYNLGCRNPKAQARCRKISCLYPKICPNLKTDHSELIALMKTVHRLKEVRRVFIASGIRMDLALECKQFIEELAANHVGGQLSVAPEHSESRVLKYMRKPDIAIFERFAQEFEKASNRAGKKQYLVPYFIVGHPGCEMSDAIKLMKFLKQRNLRPRQVQEFIPTPMSLATAMYYTSLDPMTMKSVYVSHKLGGKKRQKALALWWDKNQNKVPKVN